MPVDNSIAVWRLKGQEPQSSNRPPLIAHPSAAMPANLTPQYQRLEEQYRRAHTVQERAELLEEMLATFPGYSSGNTRPAGRSAVV